MQARGQGHLRLFVSHLYVLRSVAGAVKEELAVFGIDAFVAHDSIEPSAAWRDVIEAALRSCHAAVALLHDGFLRASGPLRKSATALRFACRRCR